MLYRNNIGWIYGYIELNATLILIERRSVLPVGLILFLTGIVKSNGSANKVRRYSLNNSIHVWFIIRLVIMEKTYFLWFISVHKPKEIKEVIFYSTKL